MTMSINESNKKRNKPSLRNFNIFLNRWTCIPTPSKPPTNLAYQYLTCLPPFLWFQFLIFRFPTSLTLDSEFAIVFTRQENANQYSTICFQTLQTIYIQGMIRPPSKELDWAMCKQLCNQIMNCNILQNSTANIPLIKLVSNVPG